MAGGRSEVYPILFLPLCNHIWLCYNSLRSIVLEPFFSHTTLVNHTKKPGKITRICKL